VVGEQRGLEIKNVGPHAQRESWGAEGTDQVPDYMLLQCQWYMWITGYTLWDLAALHGGNDLRIYTVHYDADIAENLVRAGNEFWFHVEHGEPLEPQWEAQSTSALLKRLYPGTDGTTVRAAAETFAWHQLGQQAAEQARSYEQVVEGCENHIRNAMGSAAVLVFADGSGYTRKTVNRRGYTVEPTSYVDFRFKKKLAATDE